jgi:hypothetical protein
LGPLLDDDSRVARAQAYLRGLLLDADDNKNAETIALNAHGGDASQVRTLPADHILDTVCRL